MDVIRRSLSALLAIILVTAFENTFAQIKPNAPRNQHTSTGGAPFYFDKPITLDSLTKYVHSRSRLRFSFNSTKVKGGQLIDLKKGAYTIDQLLQQIRKNTSLYYAVRNGYVIFQDNPPKIKTPAPTVAKTNPVKSPVKKVITSNSKPVQQPAKEIQPEPTVKTPRTDTAKAIIDSTHKPDSVNVFLPLTRAQTGIEDDDDNDDANKNRGWLHISFGRKPIDTTLRDTAIIDTANLNAFIRKAIAINTTTIDTSQKKGLVLAFRSDSTPVEKKKKERIKRSSIPVRIYDDVATAWSWQYGLQWKATLPFNGGKNYFTGTNTRSEPYNLLIPGIWLSTTVNYRHELMLQVKPAEWYFYDKNVYRRDTTRSIDNSDSAPKIIIRRKTTTLIKTGGWYGSLQYNYHINENWMVGAGVGYHLRAGALANQQTFKNLSDSLFAESLYSMEKGAETDKYLTSSFFTGKVEAAYRFNAWDVGATLLMPLTDAFADNSLNKSRPMNVQLFVRWRIKRDTDE